MITYQDINVQQIKQKITGDGGLLLIDALFDHLNLEEKFNKEISHNLKSV